VTVAVPKGDIRLVRILGPCCADNQIEIAESKSYRLGVDVPTRLSASIKNTPIVRLRGPAGTTHPGKSANAPNRRAKPNCREPKADTVPCPFGTVLYIKLRNDPIAINTAALPVLPNQQ
jgi:hypothetical protein